MSDIHTPNAEKLTRRAVVSGACAAFGTVVGSTAIARGQTETSSVGQAQITRMAVIPQVGPPFEGNYVGQFVIFTDPTPRDDVSPAVIAECDAVNWAPEDTRGYQVLIVDRISDDPRGIRVEAFTDQNQPRIDVGNAFIINRTRPCPGGFLELELEDVPIDTFATPAGAEADPTASPTDDPGFIDAPGQPGFGVITALTGVGTAALLRRIVRQSSN